MGALATGGARRDGMGCWIGWDGFGLSTWRRGVAQATHFPWTPWDSDSTGRGSSMHRCPQAAAEDHEPSRRSSGRLGCLIQLVRCGSRHHHLGIAHGPLGAG